MDRPDGVILVRCADGLPEFFVRWMQFLRPFHGLPRSETVIAGRMLELRWELSRGIADEGALDAELLSRRGRERLCGMCGITLQRLHVALAKFRSAGVLGSDGRIDGHYMPAVGPGFAGGRFMLTLMFDVAGDEG